MPKFNITIRQNAARNDVTVETDAGKTIVDLAELTRVERDGVRELVVNAFCRHNKMVELY